MPFSKATKSKWNFCGFVAIFFTPFNWPWSMKSQDAQAQESLETAKQHRCKGYFKFEPSMQQYFGETH